MKNIKTNQSSKMVVIIPPFLFVFQSATFGCHSPINGKWTNTLDFFKSNSDSFCQITSKPLSKFFGFTYIFNNPLTKTNGKWVLQINYWSTQPTSILYKLKEKSSTKDTQLNQQKPDSTSINPTQKLETAFLFHSLNFQLITPDEFSLSCSANSWYDISLYKIEQRNLQSPF